MNKLTKQRYISTSIWSDEWFDSLDCKDKLVYFNLLTNDHTNAAGIYPYSLKYAAVDTGLSRDELKESIKRFEEAGKAFFYKEHMIIPKWLKHQKISGRSKYFLGAIKILQSLPEDLLLFVSDRKHYDFPVEKYVEMPKTDSLSIGYAEKDDRLLIGYGYPIDSLSHDSDFDSDFDSDSVCVHTPVSENQDEGEGGSENEPKKVFLNLWQGNSDIFNFAARIDKPKEWAAFWEKCPYPPDDIKRRMQNFIDGVKSGALEKRYVPRTPDRFVLNGHLNTSDTPYTKTGKRGGVSPPPSLKGKKSLGGLE